MLIGLFTVCTTILILSSGCTKISEIPENAAAIAVPAVIVIAAWVAKTVAFAIIPMAGT